MDGRRLAACAAFLLVLVGVAACGPSRVQYVDEQGNPLAMDAQGRPVFPDQLEVPLPEPVTPTAVPADAPPARTAVGDPDSSKPVLPPLVAPGPAPSVDGLGPAPTGVIEYYTELEFPAGPRAKSPVRSEPEPAAASSAGLGNPPAR